MEFPNRDWVDDPTVSCGGFDLVSEVVVAGAVVSGFLISVVVSEVAVSEFAFANSVSSGVLSPKNGNHFLFHLVLINFQTLTQIKYRGKQAY